MTVALGGVPGSAHLSTLVIRRGTQTLAQACLPWAGMIGVGRDDNLAWVLLQFNPHPSLLPQGEGVRKEK